MQIMILDKDLAPVGAVPLYSSLIWTPRYESIGYAELHATPDYFPLMQSGSYIYRSDRESIALIENLQYAQTDAGQKSCYAKGSFAEALLKDRVISKTMNLTGNIEEVFRALVDEFAISCDDPIPNLYLGELNGISGTLNTQVTGGNLSETLFDLGNAAGISHRIRYNYLENKLFFEVWEGKDRTDAQEVNSWAIFSNSFCNVRSVEYEKNTASYKNYAYVAGEGEGAERTIITVDSRASTDEARREIWVDARDLQKEDSEGKVITDEEYLELLTERGLEKLAEYPVVETVNSDIDAQANLVYREDFDVGDVCTYINTEIGVETEKRITEIIEVYEGGAEKISVTFGSQDITTIQQLIKREVE